MILHMHELVPQSVGKYYNRSSIPPLHDTPPPARLVKRKHELVHDIVGGVDALCHDRQVHCQQRVVELLHSACMSCACVCVCMCVYGQC